MQRRQGLAMKSLSGDGLGKAIQPLIIDPVFSKRKPSEIPVSTRQEVMCCNRADGSVVPLDIGNAEISANARELDFGPRDAFDEVRELCPVADMGNDTVTLPSVRDRRRIEHVGGQVPIVLPCKSGHTTIKTMVGRGDGQ